MSLFQLALSVQSPRLHQTCSLLFWPLPHIITKCSPCQKTVVHSKCHGSLMKNNSSFVISCSVLNLLTAFPASVEEVSVSSDTMTLSDPNSNTNLRCEQVKSNERSPDGSAFEVAYPTHETKETERRRKIGLANKGRVPWNKGKKHTAETRAWIKQRTIEAMRDPKVKRKMSEAPRVHSEHVKAKISASLRQLWNERSKRKREKEKLCLSWAFSIAEAARKGGIKEEELSWCSYEAIKSKIAIQQLQLTTEKAMRKEMKRIQAESAAQARVEKKARRLVKIEREKRMRARAKRKGKLHREEKQDKEATAEEPTHTARLTKIRLKNSLKGHFTQAGTEASRYPALERLDLKLIEEEKLKKRVSLADQIRSAKSKRGQTAEIKVHVQH